MVRGAGYRGKLQSTARQEPIACCVPSFPPLKTFWQARRMSDPLDQNLRQPTLEYATPTRPPATSARLGFAATFGMIAMVVAVPTLPLGVGWACRAIFFEQRRYEVGDDWVKAICLVGLGSTVLASSPADA